jgi:hypothetical protein
MLGIGNFGSSKTEWRNMVNDTLGYRGGHLSPGHIGRGSNDLHLIANCRGGKK